MSNNKLIKGKITRLQKNGPGVPGIQLEARLRSEAGHRLIGKALTDRDGNFLMLFSSYKFPKSAQIVDIVLKDRVGTIVHSPLQRKVPTKRDLLVNVSLSTNVLETHEANPILLRHEDGPLIEIETIITRVNNIIKKLDPSSENTKDFYLSLKSLFPPADILTELYHDAFSVLEGEPDAVNRFLLSLDILSQYSTRQDNMYVMNGDLGCSGCSETRHMTDELSDHLENLSSSILPLEKALPIVVAAAHIQASGKFGTDILDRVLKPLCSLQLLDLINNLTMESPFNQRSFLQLRGIVDSTGSMPFPTERITTPFRQDRLPKIPSILCERLRACANETVRELDEPARGYEITNISPAVACPGDTITITGSALGGMTAKVSFGGVVADPRPGSTDTQITVIVPYDARTPISLILPKYTRLVCGKLISGTPVGVVNAPFEIGIPRIEAFFITYPSDRIVCIEPNQLIPLSWRVSGARSIRVEIRDESNNIIIASDPAPYSGTFYGVRAPMGNTPRYWKAKISASGICSPIQIVSEIDIYVGPHPIHPIEIDGVEITQAIQYYKSDEHLTDAADREPDNNMELVVGKTAYVRVYPKSNLGSFNGGRITGSTCSLVVRRFSVSSGWTHLSSQEVVGPIRIVTIDNNDTYDDVRRNLNRSFNFIIRRDAMWGRLELTATINLPNYPCDQTPHSMTKTITVERRPIIRIAVVPIAFNGPPIPMPPPMTPNIQIAEPDLPDFDITSLYLGQTYPVSRIMRRIAGNVTLTVPLNDPQTGPGKCSANWDTALGLITQARTNDGNRPGWLYLGLLPCGVPYGPVGGCGGGGIAMSFVNSGDTLAHEIGHSLERGHAPCGNVPPDPNYPAYEPYTYIVTNNTVMPPTTTVSGASIGEYGINTINGTIFHPSTSKDFMSSNCFPQWVSLYGYKQLLAQIEKQQSNFKSPQATITGDSDGNADMKTQPQGNSLDNITISGLIDEDGLYNITSVVHTEANPSDDGIRTNSQVELLDLEGNKLSYGWIYVTLSKGACCCGHRQGDDIEREALFHASLPFAGSGHKLRIRSKDKILWQREAFDVQPKIVLNECKAEGDYLLLNWTSNFDSKAVPDIWIQWSQLQESDWHGLSVGIKGNNTKIYIAHLPAGKVRFRLLLNDGFSTVHVTSKALELERKRPYVTIVHPFEGAHVPKGSPIMARAVVENNYEEEINAQNVSWLLDGKPAGKGKEILLPSFKPKRRHTLEVIAKNKIGTARSKIHFITK